MYCALFFARSPSCCCTIHQATLKLNWPPAIFPEMENKLCEMNFHISAAILLITRMQPFNAYMQLYTYLMVYVSLAPSDSRPLHFYPPTPLLSHLIAR